MVFPFIFTPQFLERLRLLASGASSRATTTKAEVHDTFRKCTASIESALNRDRQELLTRPEMVVPALWVHITSAGEARLAQARWLLPKIDDMRDFFLSKAAEPSRLADLAIQWSGKGDQLSTIGSKAERLLSVSEWTGGAAAEYSRLAELQVQGLAELSHEVTGAVEAANEAASLNDKGLELARQKINAATMRIGSVKRGWPEICPAATEALRLVADIMSEIPQVAQMVGDIAKLKELKTLDVLDANQITADGWPGKDL